MTVSLTDEQRCLLETVRALGRERFAPRAAKHDLEASFPYENYADLREAGLLGLTIPRRHGGLGVDYRTYALVSAELGRWCGATALTFNMHACTMLWSSQIADDLPMSDEDRAAHEERRARIYAKVVREGAVFAQPFSEPNSLAAAGQAPFGTLARQVEGGWLVTARAPGGGVVASYLPESALSERRLREVGTRRGRARSRVDQGAAVALLESYLLRVRAAAGGREE